MSYLSLGGSNDDSQDFMMPVGGGKGVGASGNSNLSALFGLNNQLNNNPNSNQALTYTAPKPPTKAAPKQQQTSSNSSQGVACAVAVTAYRYVNGQNVKQGKLGAALLKNVAEKDYKILMYVTKQQPVSTTQINPSFQFTIQPNNYASFIDDQKQTWTILFASTAQLVDFAKQICLARFFTNSQAAESSVLDLAQGETQSSPVESGDSLEMKYTGWLVNSDGSLGAVFDSNHNSEKTFRFKTGRGKVIKGWDIGVLGMRKGGKRFLVIPPQLAYGPKAVGSKVPANSTLAFEVDLLRVKQSKDNAAMQSGESNESLPQAVALSDPSPPNPAVPHPTKIAPTPSVNSESDSIKERSASLNEQLNNAPGDHSKNALLSRMARVGHAMLPMASSDPHTPDQAQITPVSFNDQQLSSHSPNITQPPSRSSTPGYNQPQPGLPHQQTHLPPQVAQPGVHFPQVQGALPQQVYPSSASPSYHSPQHYPNAVQPSSYSPSHPTSAMQSYYDQPITSSVPSTGPSLYNNTGYRPPLQYPPSHGSEFMPLLMSESRQQTTEVRLLQEKVDKVSGLVEEVKKITEESYQKEKLSSSQIMDAEVIMLNVQRIMKENEQLKGVVAEKNKQIEQQNDKISDLLQQNQKYVEKSNLILEQRNDSFKESFTQSQARSLQLEQDKVELTQRLSDATSKVSELTMEVTEQKQRESDLKQKFREHYNKEKERAEEAEEKVTELEEKLQKSVETLKSLSSVDADTKSQFSSLKENIATLEEKQKQDSEVYERNLSKLTSEKRSLETRLQEVVTSHEDEIIQLRMNTEQVTQQSKEQSEEVMTLKSRLASVEAELTVAKESNISSENKIALFQKKFAELRSAFEERQEKLQEAESEAEKVDAYKAAYERLRSQASTMKEKYEAKIVQLKEELEETDRGTGDGSADIVGEVKKIMNSIFQRVRSEIDADEEYSGAYILKLLLEIIKRTTLSLLKNSESNDDDGSDDDKEDENADKEEKNDDSEPETATIEENSKSIEEEKAAADQPGGEFEQSSDSLNDSLNQEKVASVGSASNEEERADQEDVDPAPQSPVPDSLKSDKTTGPDYTESVEEEGSAEEESGDTSGIESIRKDVEASYNERKNTVGIDESPRSSSEIEDDESVRRDLDSQVEEKAQNDKNLTANAKDQDPLGNSPIDETESSQQKSPSVSLNSSSDDRKPPPLFDDDTDEDDADWLK